MKGRETYDDGAIQLDHFALTLRRYHFPDGTAKAIPLGAVSSYRAEPLDFLVNRFRIWGTSDLRRWFPLDIHRPLRSTLITLDLPGARWHPAFTPARPAEFIALFDELLARRA